MKRCRLTLLLGTFWLSMATATSCPLKVPEGLSGSAVAQDMVSNGLQMFVTQVEGREAVSVVLERVEKAWKDGGFRVKRTKTAGWDIVSVLGENCLVTLQLSEKNGSFGYFSKGIPGAKLAVSAESLGINLPTDVKVISSVTSDDGGRQGLTLALTSIQSIDRVSDYFVKEMVQQEWKGIRAHGVKNMESGQLSQLITAQRGRRQAQIMLWAEEETHAVITIGESP